MASRVNFQYQDWEGEESSFGMRIPDITAVNVTTLDAALDAWAVAIDGVTLGTLKRRTITLDSEVTNSPLPNIAAAQREVKWLVTYTEAENPRVQSVEIPTADLTDGTLRLLNTEFANLADPRWLAFEGAFELNGRGPNGGAVSIKSIRLVGRNT